MDFTPTPPIQLKPSTSKLPIKRKTPDPTPPVNPNQFNANSPYGGGDPRSPPFKFHRIWTEPDEIRFLQGLLDCSSENLTFPRDLGIFYTRFSNTMSQPYTKSQLSEKLRRLRKKFRVISTRLSKGLDKSQLSPQDRMLYDLSKQLWHPDFAATSPFSGTRNVSTTTANNNNDDDDDNDNDDNGGPGGGNSEELVKKSSLVGVKVDFLPTFPINLEFDQAVNENGRNVENMELDCVDNENENEDEEGGLECGKFFDDHNNENEKLSEVKVKFEGEEGVGDGRNCTFGRGVKGGELAVGQNVNFEGGVGVGFGQVAAKVVMNVFNECLKEVKSGLIGHGGERANVGGESFEERWQQQRIAELDVLGHRLRLVLERSMQ